METSLTATAGAPAHAPRRFTSPRWLREPLVHFIALGCLLFAIDRVISARAGDPRLIVVDAAVDAQARDTFRAARGRDPDARELAALRQIWLDNEVLYREGLSLEVDRGDAAIRERVIFKTLSVIDAGLTLPAVDDAQLRAWFESRRARYDVPARYTFNEAVLAGEHSEVAVRAFVAMLNSGEPGETNAGLRAFKERPVGTLEQSYGADFARELDALPASGWHAVRTRDGWRAIQVEAIIPAKPAVYESMRGVVLQDWKDAKAAEQRTAAVRALARKYQVEIQAAP